MSRNYFRFRIRYITAEFRGIKVEMGAPVTDLDRRQLPFNDERQREGKRNKKAKRWEVEKRFVAKRSFDTAGIRDIKMKKEGNRSEDRIDRNKSEWYFPAHTLGSSPFSESRIHEKELIFVVRVDFWRLFSGYWSAFNLSNSLFLSFFILNLLFSSSNRKRIVSDEM